MEEGNRDLLGVSVSAEGLGHLKRLVVGTRWTFITGLIANGMFILNSIFQRMMFANANRFRSNPPLYFEIKLHLWYVLLACGLSIFQLYMYWTFSRRSATALQEVDGARFNESLRLLNRINLASQLSIIISIAFGMLEVSADIIVLSRVSHFPG